MGFYLVVLSNSFLEGSGFAEVWPQLTPMAVLATATLAFVAARFHKLLD